MDPTQCTAKRRRSDRVSVPQEVDEDANFLTQKLIKIEPESQELLPEQLEKMKQNCLVSVPWDVLFGKSMSSMPAIRRTNGSTVNVKKFRKATTTTKDYGWPTLIGGSDLVPHTATGSDDSNTVPAFSNENGTVSESLEDMFDLKPQDVPVTRKRKQSALDDSPPPTAKKHHVPSRTDATSKPPILPQRTFNSRF